MKKNNPNGAILTALTNSHLITAMALAVSVQSNPVKCTDSGPTYDLHLTERAFIRNDLVACKLIAACHEPYPQQLGMT